MLLDFAKIVLFFLCAAPSVSLGMQSKKKAMSCDVASCISEFNHEYHQQTNTQLLDLSVSVSASPLSVWDKVPAFYKQQSTHIPQTTDISYLKSSRYNFGQLLARAQTALKYLKSPILNTKKSIAYMNLWRKVNKAVYLPRANQIIEKMNQIPDPSFIKDIDAQELHDSYAEKFATLTDDADLAAQSKDLFDKEWPFYSVHFDLISQKCTIESLQKQFEKQVSELLLVEQTDRSLDFVRHNLEKDIDSLTRAINAIQY